MVELLHVSGLLLALSALTACASSPQTEPDEPIMVEGEQDGTDPEKDTYDPSWGEVGAEPVAPPAPAE